MGTRHSKRSKFLTRWTGLFTACVLSMGAMFFWAAQRNARAGKLVDEKLAALRAMGEPIDAVALAKMFPPPAKELNIGAITNTLFTFVITNRAPGLTPIIMSGASLGRTQGLDEHTLSFLRRHYEDSAAITNVMSIWPPTVRFGTDWSRGVFEAPMVSFINVRHTIQMLPTRALYAAEVGDAEGTVAMLERSFRFADAVCSDSTLVEHMIREACIGLACSMTERCLNRVKLSEAQLGRVLAAMPAPATNHFLGTFRVEHCMVVWAFSEVRAGKRLDDITGMGKSQPWWKRTWKRFWPVRNEYNDDDFLAYLELIPRVLATTRLPPRDAMAECEQLFRGFQSNATCEVASAVLPSWTNALRRHFEIEAHLEATRAALSVERFRATHQRVPENLAAVSPEFIQHAPIDLFNGQSMRIKRLAHGYVVYSVGWDGIDNGGLEKTNSPPQTNYDITVTVER